MGPRKGKEGIFSSQVAQAWPIQQCTVNSTVHITVYCLVQCSQHCQYLYSCSLLYEPNLGGLGRKDKLSWAIICERFFNSIRRIIYCLFLRCSRKRNKMRGKHLEACIRSLIIHRYICRYLSMNKPSSSKGEYCQGKIRKSWNSVRLILVDRFLYWKVTLITNQTTTANLIGLR